MTQAEHGPHRRSKAELLGVLRRLGVAPETIAEIDAKLPDPFNIDEAGAMLQAYGLTLDEAISRLGGSP
jgi:hypothetical protein